MVGNYREGSTPSPGTKPYIDKTRITFEDFKKLEIKIGKIVSAEKVENADKLLKLTIDLGSEGNRTIVAGVAEFYSPEQLIGKLIPILVNLEPRTLRGIESQGMMLAAGLEDGRAIILEPEQEVPPGTEVR